MTDREKFEKWLNTLDKQTLVTMAAKQTRTIEELQAATKAAAPEGWKLVTMEPTPEMLEAYFAGKIEAQSCTHQQRARERVARDYKAMLEAAPDGDK